MIGDPQGRNEHYSEEATQLMSEIDCPDDELGRMDSEWF